jgi:hypothetical protein
MRRHKMTYRLEYKIEKGVAIPEVQDFKLPLAEMEIGDSFFCPLLDWVSMGMMSGKSAIHECIRLLSPKDREYKTRTVEGGFRVWRTE